MAAEARKRRVTEQYGWGKVWETTAAAFVKVDTPVKFARTRVHILPIPG
jgi:hypothetical protein